MAFWASLGDVASGVIDLFPRLQIVRANEFGIKFVKGKDYQEVGPGVVVYWPLVTEIEVRSSAIYTLETQPQNLTTGDRRSVIASSVMRYRIVDLKKYLIDNDDSDDSLGETLRAALRDIVSNNSSEDLFDPDMDFEGSLRDSCQEMASTFGVEIISARFSDFSETSSLTVHGLDFSGSDV